MAGTDAQRIAASGRTLDEHRDIVRALETDPRGSRSVRLDFESGDFSGWSVRRLAKEYSAVIQSEFVRSGTKACRFEIRPGDRVSQGFRAELRDWYNAPFEADTWYGFSTYLPTEFAPPKGVGVVLAQWHDQAELGDPAGGRFTVGFGDTVETPSFYPFEPQLPERAADDQRGPDDP